MSANKKVSFKNVSVTHIDDLKIFARVVTAGNMSAAAREMGLSPAVVSKRISSMEEKLGTRLFQRTTRQLQLTEAGVGFFDRVVAILASIEEAEAFLADGQDSPRGILKISAPVTFSRMHLVRHLPEFLNLFPGVSIDLQASDEVVDIVAEGIDVAIRVSDASNPSFTFKKLAPIRRVLCASPEYLQKRGTPTSIDDLRRHNCFGAGVNATWRLSGPEGPVTVKPVSTLRTNSNDIIRECMIAGLGIGFKSTWNVHQELRDGKLVVVLPQYREPPNFGLYAVYAKQYHMPAKLRVFIDFLSKRFSPEPYWDKGLDAVISGSAKERGLSSPAGD